MQSVMISIRPQWCELIASGQKTIEVRKSRPKLETPFKCYIYCVKDPDKLWVLNEQCRQKYDGLTTVCANLVKSESLYEGNGKVIGKFMCNKIDRLAVCGNTELQRVDDNLAAYDLDCDYLNKCQLSLYELKNYSNGNGLYGWHISDLVIYDEPRELSEFLRINRECWYADLGLAKRDCPECKNAECFVSRPPQSWCYVEEVRK